jgi:hypothetical protein
MEKEKQTLLIKYFSMKNWLSTKSHQELVTTLGADVYGWSQIEIWLEKFRNGDLSGLRSAFRTDRPLSI